MRFFPSGSVTKGCNLGVANVYTWPVSEATSSSACVPVSVVSSYACAREFLRGESYRRSCTFFMRPALRLLNVICRRDLSSMNSILILRRPVFFFAEKSGESGANVVISRAAKGGRGVGTAHAAGRPSRVRWQMRVLTGAFVSLAANAFVFPKQVILGSGTKLGRVPASGKFTPICALARRQGGMVPSANVRSWIRL